MYYPSQELDDNLVFAANLKRSGRVDEAIAIYEQLDIKYPNSGAVNMSWAKSLAVYGYYQLAIRKFNLAMKQYKEEGDIEKSMTCFMHMDKLESYKLQGFNIADSSFIEYIKSISGQPDQIFRMIRAKN